MYKKAFILSASSGYGHIRAAQALEQAFTEVRLAQDLRHIDTLHYSTWLFKVISSTIYIGLVNKSPQTLDFLTSLFEKPWETDRGLTTFYKYSCLRLVKMLEQQNPDLMVCTHFVPALIISALKEQKKLSGSLAVVLTDYDAQANWLCRHFDKYFVPLEENRAHMAKLGLPAEKITVTGIPIDPIFAQQKDKAAMRAKLGLKQDTFTLLISTGGFGVGPLEKLVTSFFGIKHDVQLVIICGKREDSRKRINDLIAQRAPGDRLSITTVGYTTDMDEYMAASDMLVGKAGGLTMSEALAKGLIMIIVDPLPVWEQHNANHMLEAGVALRCHHLPALAHKVDQLLDDPERLARMRENVKRFARPRAAYDIAAALLGMA